MKHINKYSILIAAITLVLGFVVGWLVFSGDNSAHKHEEDMASEPSTTYTCSMHPQIRQNEPGDCPICGMELIPVSASTEEGIDPDAVKMSATAMKLANVQTAMVRKETPRKKLQLTGKVQADERNTYVQTSHFSGRVERLLVDFTGEYVRKGQTIAYLYAPELVTAQEELLEASNVKKTQPALWKAAQNKLKNWKLTERQIEEVVNSGKVKEQFPLLADVSGIVLERNVNLGDYVQRGQALFKIANLSRLWIMLDVYEEDLKWIQKGDSASITVNAIPGETFQGKVDYIDPVINPTTRVARARVTLANREGRLKPEMFVEATILAGLEAGEYKKVLVVPSSSVMWTGDRSVVYVKQESEAGVSFIMREVTVSANLGDHYWLKKGLKEGEEIAVNGTFSIDAAAQLAGKPSMMAPNMGAEEEVQEVTQFEVSTKAKEALAQMVSDYLGLKNNLVQDDLTNAQQAVEKLLRSTKTVKMNWFEGEAHMAWMDYSKKIVASLKTMEDAGNLEGIRKPFITLSEQMIFLSQAFQPMEQELYIQFCPMADHNKGADWLSMKTDILNPYFGDAMLTCGEVTDSIAPLP